MRASTDFVHCSLADILYSACIYAAYDMHVNNETQHIIYNIFSKLACLISALTRKCEHRASKIGSVPCMHKHTHAWAHQHSRAEYITVYYCTLVSICEFGL